jgi:hypothetical protein
MIRLRVDDDKLQVIQRGKSHQDWGSRFNHGVQFEAQRIWPSAQAKEALNLANADQRLVKDSTGILSD